MELVVVVAVVEFDEQQEEGFAVGSDTGFLESEEIS